MHHPLTIFNFSASVQPENNQPFTTFACARNAKKKAAAAKKAKPELTPEQVEKKKAVLQKAEIKDLKKAALEPPARNNHTSAWLVFAKEKGSELRERIANESDSNGKASPAIIQAQLSAHIRNVAAAWKNVTPSELEVCTWLDGMPAITLSRSSLTRTALQSPRSHIQRSC